MNFDKHPFAEIAAKVAAGERLSTEDGLLLDTIYNEIETVS